jgi:hypothetical protein
MPEDRSAGVGDPEQFDRLVPHARGFLLHFLEMDVEHLRAQTEYPVHDPGKREKVAKVLVDDAKNERYPINQINANIAQRRNENIFRYLKLNRLRIFWEPPLIFRHFDNLPIL